MSPLSRALPKLVIAPSVALSVVCVYGFILITLALSFTESRLLPNWEWAGLERYSDLFDNDRWWTSIINLAIFGSLFVAISMVLGLFMAILLDQKIRAEGFLRAIYLYPMALSFIITGTAWKWLLNPSQGLEKLMHDWGWVSFQFDWLVNTDYVIYCVVIAAVWQSVGFAMALFLAGLRGVDASLLEAARIDGANTWTIYQKVIIPTLRPVFLSVTLILAHIAIKSFDLVMALTAGGPGTASDVPAIFMYQFSFNRGQLGLGAASAMMLFCTVMAIAVPLLYSESRRTAHG
jgi:glucose/mannose transport system permease protein